MLFQRPELTGLACENRAPRPQPGHLRASALCKEVRVARAYVKINVAAGKEREVRDRLRKRAEVASADLTSGDQDIIALGDFNADGSYYDEDDNTQPLMDSMYHWTVSNEVDTMTKTDWTYDRIVMLDPTYTSEYVMDSTAVYYFNDVYGLNQTFTEAVSDHFPVFAEFRVNGPDDD